MGMRRVGGRLLFPVQELPRRPSRWRRLSLAPPLVFVPEHTASHAVAHMLPLLAALRPRARSAGRSLGDRRSRPSQSAFRALRVAPTAQ